MRPYIMKDYRSSSCDEYIPGMGVKEKRKVMSVVLKRFKGEVYMIFSIFLEYLRLVNWWMECFEIALHLIMVV